MKSKDRRNKLNSFEKLEMNEAISDQEKWREWHCPKRKIKLWKGASFYLLLEMIKFTFKEYSIDKIFLMALDIAITHDNRYQAVGMYCIGTIWIRTIG